MKDKAHTNNKEAIELKTTQRMAVIGMGPVGMTLATHFKEAGCEVAICEKDRLKTNKIRKEGVRLLNVIKKTTRFEHIYTDIRDLQTFKPSLIIFSLKTHQMPAALEQAACLISDNTYALCAQNGIDVEFMPAAVFGDSKTLRMVLNFAGNLNSPNEVKITFFNPPNFIASIDDSCKMIADEISALLNSVNLTTRSVDSFEIIKRAWEKTILNASLSALCGIGKLTIREAMEMPDTMEVVEQIIEEAVEVAGAEKIFFEDDFIRKCIRYLKKAGPHFPSLAVDLINNRPTEIDFLNGKIVAYGRKHYIRTSLNLVFTNMVKAMTNKKLQANMSGIVAGREGNSKFAIGEKGKIINRTDETCFLGVDLGSAYTKFNIINNNGQSIYSTAIKTIDRDKLSVSHVLEAIRSEFNISYTCATGYGRKHLHEADMIKTEINCAALGVSAFAQGGKNIIDIGGEDIKVVHCNADDQVENFYLNDKCAAGTGSFLTEIADRAEIPITEMSVLASKSSNDAELNSFCTVFAKTEIMSWLFEGKSVDDIARGIYLSIANRIFKLRIDPQLPIYVIGGVIEHHPYLAKILEPRYGQKVNMIAGPQFVVSLGAALFASNEYKKTLKKTKTAKPTFKA